jgi:hypothetical protein
MPDEPVVLYNSSRFRSFQFTLYHSVICNNGVCHCGKMPAMGQDRRGEFVRAEGSVFISARAHSRPLPQSVLKIPQVQTAMAEPMFIKVANKLADVRVFQPGVQPGRHR